MNLFKRQIGISTILLINTVAIVGISLFIVGYFWISQEKQKFEVESDKMRVDYINSQKAFLKREVEHVLRYLQFNRNQIEERLKISLKTRVYEAHSIAFSIWEANKAKKSKDEIIAMIRSALEDIRFFDGRGYYFATQLDGLVLLFADRPEEVGKNYWDLPDSTGVYISREMSEIARKQNEGYLKYTMTKPGSKGSSHPKIAFVKNFKPLNFYIGTGEYLDDFEGDIKRETLKLIHSMEYGGNGYIFVGQWDGLSLSGPGLGKNMIDVTDRNGLKIVQELIKVSKQGGGFVTYVMPSFDGKKNALKMSYAQGFEDWQWYIGAGKYIDEIDAVINERRVTLENQIQSEIIGILAILTLGLLLISVLARFLSRRIDRNIQTIVGFFDNSSQTFKPIDLSRLHFPEFSKLARAANRMVEERNRAELALMDREEQLNVILNSIKIGVLIVDPDDFCIVKVNPHAAEMAKLVQDEMVGSRLNRILGAQAEELYFDRDLLLSGQAIELSLLASDHTKIPILKSSAEIYLNGKKHYLESFIDISDVKSGEKEVEALRNHLKNIIDSMSSAIFAVDLEGFVSQYNSATEKVLDITLDKEEKVSWKQLLDPFNVEEEKIENAILQNRFYRMEKIELFKGDQRFFFDLSVYPLSQEPVSGVVVRIDEVTERVRLSELLIQTEKMMSIGGLAAGMAHEINNPLAAILQGVQVLELRLGERSPALQKLAEKTGSTETKIYRHLEEYKIPRMILAIKESGLRAAKIVANMLSFSKKSDFNAGSHDIRELMEQTIELATNDYDLKKHFDFKKLAIHREYDPSLSTIECEASQIQQVFLNILKNAAHAMMVTAERRPPQLNLDIRRKYNSVIVEIEDNGPGMDNAVKKRIFEPFFTTKSGNLGTGLGLSVSYFIITENHGGSISVDSIPGKGSRFTIALPISNHRQRTTLKK